MPVTSGAALVPESMIPPNRATPTHMPLSADSLPTAEGAGGAGGALGMGRCSVEGTRTGGTGNTTKERGGLRRRIRVTQTVDSLVG